MAYKGEKITTFSDVHRVLSRYLPPVRSQRGAYTLERMQVLMDYLGNPQNDYLVVHVAGTSGKTSTCYYLAAMFVQAGVRTGLAVSPHVDEVNERAQINIKPLTEKQYTKEFTVFMNLVEKSGVRPTYFELLTAFAFWEFKRQACDIAVIEVGLGGLLDATNVITNRKKLNVITDIGFDHEEVLGKTLGLIASQKAGIIKPYNTVVCYEQKDEIMQVIREVAAQQQAKLHELWPIALSTLPRSLPLFQRRNWYLALAAYNVAVEHGIVPELNAAQLDTSTQVAIPARMETIHHKGKTVIMDGAHNSQKLHAFTASLKKLYPKDKKTVLVSLLASKQSRVRQCLEELLPACDNLIITTFATENHEKVSIDPLKIAAICEELGFESWEVKRDPIEAYKKLLRSRNPVLVVTGSFYLLNHIRPLIRETKRYTK